jgi:hypothetical protein
MSVQGNGVKVIRHQQKVSLNNLKKQPNNSGKTGGIAIYCKTKYAQTN